MCDNCSIFLLTLEWTNFIFLFKLKRGSDKKNLFLSTEFFRIFFDHSGGLITKPGTVWSIRIILHSVCHKMTDFLRYFSIIDLSITPRKIECLKSNQHSSIHRRIGCCLVAWSWRHSHISTLRSCVTWFERYSIWRGTLKSIIMNYLMLETRAGTKWILKET